MKSAPLYILIYEPKGGLTTPTSDSEQKEGLSGEYRQFDHATETML